MGRWGDGEMAAEAHVMSMTGAHGQQSTFNRKPRTPSSSSSSSSLSSSSSSSSLSYDVHLIVLRRGARRWEFLSALPQVSIHENAYAFRWPCPDVSTRMTYAPFGSQSR
ncbi:hypothetical protein Vafri_13073, partial [Volvox africanus]